MSWSDTGYGRPGYREESAYKPRTDEQDQQACETRRRLEEIREARRLAQALRDPWGPPAGARAPVATLPEG